MTSDRKPVEEPAELRAALNVVPGARQGWERQPPVVCEAYSSWVAKGRKADKRVARAAETAQLAAADRLAPTPPSDSWFHLLPGF